MQRHVCSGSTESGRIKVFSLATGGEVLKSDVQWTDGSSAFDCCFGQKETLICCAPKEKSGRLTILSFDNDMAAPTVKWISVCDTGDNPMNHVAMSDDGTMAACASKRGTYVYVVSVAEGKVIRTFSRGSTPARILALRFSVDGEFLALNSVHGTYHLFGIAPGIKNYTNFLGYVWSNEQSKYKVRSHHLRMRHLRGG